jgi:DNA-binding beta-propeller fold protein YncE
MRTTSLIFAFGIAMIASFGLAQPGPNAEPYKVLRTIKVGGDGGFDYVIADVPGRRLYVPRSGNAARITVFDLDTLAPIGEIANTGGHGAVVDPKSNHGFSTAKPLVMFDAKTLTTIKTIDVQGNPDGIMLDAANQRVYDLSHVAPNVTVIDAKDGSIVGTIDIGGAPEQAVTDGKGHLYIDVEDKGNIAVIDAKSLAVTAHYDISSKGGTCAGLALDAKNNILFATCRDPQTMVILNALDGKIITSLPIGMGSDGAAFNPNTMEAFSSHGDGTLTVVKENSPTDFVVEQTVPTMISAKTMALDTKTNRIFLIAAEFGPATAPPQPGRPARGPMVPDSFSILEVGK